MSESVVLAKGQRVTLFKMDNMMALTHRYELEVREPIDPKIVGYDHRCRVGVVRQKGKRKDQYLDLAHDDILLNGWNLPVKCDGECLRTFHGNACYNLVGDMDEVKRCLVERSLRPLSDEIKGKVIVYKPDGSNASSGELAWPEIDTRHAVIERMKEAAESPAV
jgi:hypothetical protein